MGTAVRLLVGIEVAARGHAIVRAAIAELVNVERMFSRGHPSDLAGNGHEAVFLGEDDLTHHLALADGMQYGHRFRGTGHVLTGRRDRPPPAAPLLCTIDRDRD